MLSLPPYSLPFIGFVSLIPFFKALDDGAGIKESLIYGSFTYFLIMHWLVKSISRYGGIPWIASASMVVLLSLYNGLYIAAFSFLYRRLPKNALLLSSCFLTLEYVRANLLTGLPWGSLGLNLERPIQMMQIASIFGLKGCTFAVALVNILLYKSIKEERPRNLVISGILILSLFLFGSVRLKSKKNGENCPKILNVALCQPNVDQGVKWDLKYIKSTLSNLEELALKGAGSDLVVFPETSVPGFLSQDQRLKKFILPLSRRVKAFIGTGALHREKGKMYNSFFLISPKHGIVGRYDKTHLVPFGEFTPLFERFSALRKISLGGNYSPGKNLKLFRVGRAKIGVLICFESIFEDISRKYVKMGADVILNITNDGWFGRSPGPYQHFSYSRFRAVENGVYYLRCASTGISAVISPYGEVLEKLPLETKGIIKFSVPDSKIKTFYTSHGYLFPKVVSIVSLVLLPVLWV